MPTPRAIPQVQQLPVTSPIGGVVRAIAREEQPQSTCWNAVNILPYDLYGRRRVAQRPGITKQYSTQLTNTSDQPSFIQGMLEAPNIIYPGGIWGLPIGGISTISGFNSTFSTGILGPFLWGGPSGSVLNVPWNWRFFVDMTVVALDSTSGPVFGWVEFYVPLSAGNDPLIVYVNCDGSSTGSGQTYSPIVSLYSGKPADPQSNWTLLGFAHAATQTSGVPTEFGVTATPGSSTLSLDIIGFPPVLISPFPHVMDLVLPPLNVYSTSMEIFTPGHTTATMSVYDSPGNA